MRNKFEQELDELNRDLVKMGGLIETAISKAMTALKEKNIALAKEVISSDNVVDELESAIERKSLRILLSEQPVARDLRSISTALKMITDMERICDQAADIAEIIVQFEKREYEDIPAQISQMAQKCVTMVSKSIDAFITSDLDLANAVIASDDEVDALFDSFKERLISLIQQDARKGEEAVDLLMIAKYLERIGDHATNISEGVVFNITGKHKGARIL